VLRLHQNQFRERSSFPCPAGRPPRLAPRVGVAAASFRGGLACGGHVESDRHRCAGIRLATRAIALSCSSPRSAPGGPRRRCQGCRSEHAATSRGTNARRSPRARSALTEIMEDSWPSSSTQSPPSPSSDKKEHDHLAGFLPEPIRHRNTFFAILTSSRGEGSRNFKTCVPRWPGTRRHRSTFPSTRLRRP